MLSLPLHRQSGQAPLHVAAMENNFLAVQKLLAGGACRSLPDKVILHLLLPPAPLLPNFFLG